MTDNETKRIFSSGYDAGYKQAIREIFNEQDCCDCLLDFLKNQKKEEMEKLRQNEKEMYELLDAILNMATFKSEDAYWNSEIKELLEKVKYNR